MAVKRGNRIRIRKDVGKVDEVNGHLHFSEMRGNIGMAHTRWATHGANTKDNAHPQVSNDGRVAVVHNGVVENYQSLRAWLSEQGYSFKSETDTEVIPLLIGHYLKDGISLEDAVRLAKARLVGQFAIVVMDRETDVLICTRRESPLVLGIGNGEYFAASDIPAFWGYAKKVVYLHDDDMAVLSPNGLVVKDIEGVVVDRPLADIQLDVESSQKGNYDHYFIKEVMEQIETIQRLVSGNTDVIKMMAAEMKKAVGIYLVACGTAAHACMYGLYMFSKIAKTHLNFCVASEFDNFKHFLTESTLVVAISQSGETADTLSAIHSAKAAGAKVASITNVNGSTINRESDLSMLQQAGLEVCVVSTKAYTSQLAILFMIANELVGKLDSSVEELKEVVRYLYYLTSESMREHIKDLALMLFNKQHIYLIGRGLQYPTAMEAALKIKEACYIHAEAFPGGELKHGAIAMIEKGTPCIVFASEDTESDIITNCMELKARGAFIIGVAEKPNGVFDFFIKVRESACLNSICQIIPMQLLAYQLAILRGCDPDKPRNLAKSVTVK